MKKGSRQCQGWDLGLASQGSNREVKKPCWKCNVLSQIAGNKEVTQATTSKDKRVPAESRKSYWWSQMGVRLRPPTTLTQACFLSRLLRKQLHRYKHKLQDTYTLQKEQNRRFETKIRELTTNQDNLWTKLQHIKQDLQVQMWGPLATWTAWKSNLKSALPGWGGLLSQSFPGHLAQPLLLSLPSPRVFVHSHPPYWGSNRTKCSCVVFDLKISLYIVRKNWALP